MTVRRRSNFSRPKRCQEENRVRASTQFTRLSERLARAERVRALSGELDEEETPVARSPGSDRRYPPRSSDDERTRSPLLLYLPRSCIGDDDLPRMFRLRSAAVESLGANPIDDRATDRVLPADHRTAPGGLLGPRRRTAVLSAF